MLRYRSHLLPLLLVTACADATQPPQGEKGDPGEMGAPGAMGAVGVSCWDLNSNHECDVLNEDYNDDGICDSYCPYFDFDCF